MMGTFRLGIIGLETLSNDPFARGAPPCRALRHVSKILLSFVRSSNQPSSLRSRRVAHIHFFHSKGSSRVADHPQDEAIATRDQELSCSTEKSVSFRYPVLEFVILAGLWMQAVEC